MVKDILDKLLGPGAATGESAADRLAGPAAGPVAVIALVTGIDNAAGRELTARLAALLETCRGIEVRPSRRGLKLPPEAGLIERLSTASAMGRSWLSQEGADVLVWGEAVGGEGAAAVHFVPALLDAEGKTGTFGLGDTLEMPAGFGDEFGDILAAAAMAAAVPVKLGRDTNLGPLLAAAVARVNGFVEMPPRGLTAAQSVALLTCLGNCFAALWRVDTNDARLDRAIRIYNLALDSCAPDMNLARAMIQNHLAAVHEAMAAHDADAAHLEAAAKAYHAVATALGQEEHAMDWAFAQIRLGMILYRLALRRDSDAARMQASVRAFEAARTVLKRDDAPDRWAEVSNQLGVALMALGTQVAGTEALERSVAAFREALEVRRREAAPLLWAQTANNLGAASFALSQRKTVPGLLEEALRCFEEARGIYAKYRQQKTVAVIEKNMARVRERLGRR